MGPLQPPYPRAAEFGPTAPSEGGMEAQDGIEPRAGVVLPIIVRTLGCCFARTSFRVGSISWEDAVE